MKINVLLVVVVPFDIVRERLRAALARTRRGVERGERGAAFATLSRGPKKVWAIIRKSAVQVRAADRSEDARLEESDA
ncbi:MAG TPA: hypothetical protein VEZ16_05465 [Microvirga sp.]|nr:hypothetical protein [Microvirga sp.]